MSAPSLAAALRAARRALRRRLATGLPRLSRLSAGAAPGAAAAIWIEDEPYGASIRIAACATGPIARGISKVGFKP